MPTTRAFTRLLVLALALGACTASPPRPPETVVTVADFRMVAGRWQGLVSGIAGQRADGSDAIQVTIGEDGTYDFGIYRTVGAFQGKGRLSIRDGKLVTEHQPRPTTFTLYERDGQRRLKGDAVLSNGQPVSVDLKPVR